MAVRRSRLIDLQFGSKKAEVVRVKANWSPSGIALWLIAALIATIVVCNEEPSPRSPEPPDIVELELESGD
jgi:hypothetical protein